MLIAALIVPRLLCEQRAGGFFEGDAETETALADVVAEKGMTGVTPSKLHTGSAHFDGEWALVTNQMTVLGLGQLVLAHPELKPRYLPAIRAAVKTMLLPESRAFGTSEWGEDGLTASALQSDNGHVYLGYLDMALSMQRLVDDQMPQEDQALNDQLTAALVRRLERSPHSLIETFPGVTFPTDVASAIGAIGLHARATKTPLPEVVKRWVNDVAEKYVDSESGLLVQTANPQAGTPTGPPRGSGTALALYFIAFADEGLARSLDTALAKRAHRTFFGFGGVAEYPENVAPGRGDIDSGPVVFGVSVAATGFGISGARLFKDRARFVELYRTAYLFGAPAGHDEKWSYLVGEGLGDAILLAMMTASPEAVLPR